MQDFDSLKLANQLCFPLYACAKEVVRRYKPFLDDLGLTYTQYIAMMVLWEKESVSVKELGECLLLDSGTLTPLLKKMEAHGLITRKRNANDERSVIASITKQGMDLREQAVSIPGKIGACLPIEPADAGALYSILCKILHGFSESEGNAEI